MTTKQQELYDKFIEMVNRGDNEQSIIDTVDELLDTYIKPLEVLKKYIGITEVNSSLRKNKTYTKLYFKDDDLDEHITILLDDNKEREIIREVFDNDK